MSHIFVPLANLKLCANYDPDDHIYRLQPRKCQVRNEHRQINTVPTLCVRFPVSFVGLRNSFELRREKQFLRNIGKTWPAADTETWARLRCSGSQPSIGLRIR